MPPAIKAVQTGQLVHLAPATLPRRIHGGAIIAGVSGCDKRGKDRNPHNPKNIVTDGPVVTKANADGMLWMEEAILSFKARAVVVRDCPMKKRNHCQVR